MSDITRCSVYSYIRSYIWVISKIRLDVKQDGDFTMVNKIPIRETQEITVTDEKNIFEGSCTIEKAQNFLDDKYPNHLVLSVRDNCA